MIHKIDLQMRNCKLKPKLIADPRQRCQKLIGLRMVSLNTCGHQLNINPTHDNKIERNKAQYNGETGSNPQEKGPLWLKLNNVLMMQTK